MALEWSSQRARPYMEGLDPSSQRNAAYLPSASRNAVAGASAAQGTEIARPDYPTQFRMGYDAAGGGAAPPRGNPTVLTTGSVNGFAPDADQPYPNNDPYKVPVSSQRNQLVGGSLPSMSSDFNTVQMPRSAGMFAPSEFSGPTIRIGTSSNPSMTRSGAPTWADMAARKESRFARTLSVNQQIADAAMMRANNEFPLAQMQASTSERGQDLGFMSNQMQDVTSRRGQDVQQRGQNLSFDAQAASDMTQRANIASVAEASKYRTDSELTANLPRIQQQDRINTLNDAGRYDEAEALASQGHPRTKAVPKVEWDPQGQIETTTHPDGRQTRKTAKSILAEIEAASQAALRESEAKVKDDERKRKEARKAEGL